MTITHHRLFEAHSAQRNALLGLVNQTRELAARLGDADENADKDLDGLAASLATDRFRVMVFGQFKAGKSTLVNAMLGEGVLPARGTPCTALLTVVRWGEQPAVLLHSRARGDGPQPAPRRSTVEEFHRWSTIQKEKAKDARKATRPDADDDNPYTYAELHWPLEVLRNQVEIIDSPGLNEHPDREKVTLKFLAETDALIVTMSAVNPFGLTEQRYLDQIVAKYGHRDLFFAINRINQVNDVEDVIERDLEMAAPYTTDVKHRVFHLNAYGSLQARSGQPGAPPDTETGVPDLEAALADFLAHDRGAAKIGRAARTLQQSISDLRPRLTARRQMLDRDAEELRAAYAAQRSRIDRLGDDRKDMLTTFTTWISDTERDVRDLSRGFYRDAAAQVPDWVEEIDREQHLTLNPLKAKEQAKALIDEVSVGLSERMTIAAGAWQEETLHPALTERAAALAAALGPKAKDYLDAVAKIRGELTGAGDVDVTVDEPGAVSKLVGTLAGLLTVGSAIGGARLGAKAGLLTIAGGAFTALFAVYVLGITNPYLIIGMIFGANILQTFGLLEGQETKIVKRVAEVFAEDLQKNGADHSAKFAAEVRATLEAERDKTGQRIAKELAVIVADVKATLGHHERGKGAVEKVRAGLNETEQTLNDVERKVLTMTSDLAG